MFVYNASGQLVAEYSTQIASTPQVSYLTTDHLGSPRVITNEAGTVKDRKDYSAFGEESVSAQRNSNSEYSAADQLRKNYTGYEKDGESGLEFAQARYYNPNHGRYTSVDPLTASASIRDPQTFNRYSYVLNSPYKFSDPLGLIPSSTGACGQWCPNSGPTVDGSAFRGRDATFDGLKTQTELWRAFISQVSAALGIADGGQMRWRSGQQTNSAAPPQINIEGITLVMRTPKRYRDGRVVEGVYEETVLAVGSKPLQDAGQYDSEVNLNGAAEGLMNIGQIVYLKVNLRIDEVGGTDRAAFDDNATSTGGTISNILKQKPQGDTIISSDGKRMTVDVKLEPTRDGLPKGKVSTITLSVKASYYDQYDSTTNQVGVSKTVTRDIRISLTNPATNPFLKKSK